MNWECSQLEQRLTDYLDGRLGAAEQAAADTHARACPRCAEWFEARQGALWLRQLEPLESPPGLETRILALTAGPRIQTARAGWRALLQPRFAMGLGSAVFSLLLVLNAMGFSLRNLRASDLKPSNMYSALSRSAHQSYAWSVRFVNDLRVVYEIRSRLEPEEEAEPAAPPAATPPAPAPSGEPPKQEQKPKPKSSEGVRGYWLFASQLPGVLGEPR